MKITYVSSCLLKKSNKVLITSRPKGKFLSGFWEIPGGKLFNNESFEDCAVRELYEEIGVYINKEDLKNIDLVTHRYKINRRQIKEFNFLPGSQVVFDRIYENYYKFFK